MSIAKFSVDNHVLINMLLIIVFIGGIFTMVHIPKEEMPAVDMGFIVLGVVYPGVSPEEMETLVLNKIEEEISDVANIDFISSTASEGRVVISISFEPDADIDKAWNDINAELDKVNDLPEDAMDPWIIRINMREINEMCDISLGGDFSPNALRELAEDLKLSLLDVANVSKVSVRGTRDREIWVEADAYKLNALGLTLSDLNTAIQLRNQNVPAGNIDFNKVEYIVRTMGEFNSVEEIDELVIRTDANGRFIRVKDVATITDTLEEARTIGKLNMESGVLLRVYKKEDGDVIRVMEDIRELVADFKTTTSGLTATVRNDDSIAVKDSISTLGTSALLGVILVFVILWIFIGWRNAIFAVIGIPFSFFLTFILMRQFGVTMNTLSLFGLVLVLGMIVDDAIIVMENIQRYMEKGIKARDAVIKGTSEIMWPVIAAVTTTIAAFLPMFIMQGMMGKFMRVFPIVVTLALAASLFECLVVLPSHIAEFNKKQLSRKKRGYGKFMQWILLHYNKVLKWVLGHRAMSVLFIFVALAFTIMTFAFHWVQFEFFPSQESQTIVLKLRTSVGTSLDQTNSIITEIEKFVFNMPEKDDIGAIVTYVGGMVVNNHSWEEATSNAEVKIDIVAAKEMKFTHDQIKSRIRDFLKELPGLYSYRFAVPSSGPPTGNDVEVRIKGDNLDRLQYMAEIVKDELRVIPGVEDIEDSFKPGKSEIRITPRNDNL
ncbi:MAG: efflux RND transporter permease subunit, partial [Candidatus Cloacimonetes bacterium]|nr:efflux RND transporter permease subunit [Candidatus Cloacimonadota bacterium]